MGHGMDHDLELDIFPHEPTVLEYARFHGLCRDYTQEPLELNCALFPSADTLDADLQDPKNAAPLTKAADELTKERLSVDKEAAMLLKMLQSLQNEALKPAAIPNGRKRLLGLKQEVPILHTDNELDMLEFGSVVECGFKDLKIPLEPVSEEADEGLNWPSRYSEFPEQCLAQVKYGKLAVSRDTLLYLHDATRDSHVSESYEMFPEDCLSYRKNIITRPITPPLLLSTPEQTPYIPSSPGNYLPLVSDDSNSTAAEAKALEEQIMDTDTLTGPDFDGDDFVLLDTIGATDDDPMICHDTSPRVKRKTSDLKVEGPLTPRIFSESPMKRLKTVAFAETLFEYIPMTSCNDSDGGGSDNASGKEGNDKLEFPSNFENRNDILTEEDDYAFFKIIEPAKEDVNRQIENEKLLEADTTRRMDVPHVNFQLPTAPWEEFTRANASEGDINAQSRFIEWVKRNQMRFVTSWHGVSELERRLPLGPFSYTSSKFSVEEKLHGEDVVKQILSSINDEGIATSSTDIWKRSGLRILEDDEDEDDVLGHDEQEKENDIRSLTKKRMIELQEENTDVQSPAHRPARLRKEADNKHYSYHQGQILTSAHWNNNPKSQCVDQTASTVDHQRKAMHTQESDTSLMFGGKFSATSALDKFMALNGKGVLSMPVSQGMPILKHQPECQLPSPVRPTHQLHKDKNFTANEGVQSGLTMPRPSLDLPTVPTELPSCSFVISSAFLQRRSLTKQIQSLYPDAEFVSRDFDLQYKDSEEADLIISPSTGLIVTTIQQLKQCALPGQPTCSPMKDRILALQVMYERLIILVSEGLSKEWEGQSGSRCLDNRDQEALDDYRKFASQLEGEILVRYAPGGEQALARTAVNVMAEYGLPHGSQDIGDVKLLTDQTTWELFLRRAGLNAFAAQVILALLKNPITWPHPSSNVHGTFQTCGLQTFLFMSAEQRAQNFQTILGGKRVLTSVSRLLDEPWPSAAHGFHM